jgi:hypothetical protein
VAYDYVMAPGGDRVTSVEVRLAPFESCLIVFGTDTAAPVLVETDARGQWELARDRGRAGVRGLVPEAGRYVFTGPSGRKRAVAVSGVPPPMPVTGPWTLALGARSPVRLDRLRPWAEVEGGAGFSGWGVYETELPVPEVGADISWFVDLGVVHETAQVTLNGRDLGAAWKGTRRVACGEAIAKGPNRLRVEVANLWIHHVLAHPPGDPTRRLKGVGADPDVAETAGIRWGTYGEVPPKDVPPSGLLGPVSLVAMKRVAVRL